MKTIYKITIIIALVPVVIFGGQVILLIGSIQIGGFLVGLVSDDAFDKEMRQLEQVRLFHEQYGESAVGHGSDIIAWKIIIYSTWSPDGNKEAYLIVQKSMFHGSIRMQFSCVYDIQAREESRSNYELYQNGNLSAHDFDDSEFTLSLVDPDEISDYLKNKHCFDEKLDKK